MGRAAEAVEWDSQTFYTWVKANEVNPDFMRLVATATDAIFGQEPRDLSLLYVLFYLAASGDETTPAPSNVTSRPPKAPRKNASSAAASRSP